MKKEKEGSKMPAYRSLAAQEYQESKDKARYISIAQKLAQHINNLAEDKNTRIRWIWELIQNAKDVPNEFGRCRMTLIPVNDYTKTRSPAKWRVPPPGVDIWLDRSGVRLNP